MNERNRLTAPLSLHETHTITYLLKLDEFSINAVDKDKLLIGPWFAQLLLTFEGDLLSLVTDQFKQAKCALTFINQIDEIEYVFSDNEVLF